MDFVTFSTAGWDDPWVLTLDIERHQVWHYLITGPDFATGNSVAERNTAIWPIRIKLPMERVDAILKEFEAAGKVAIYGDVVWVVNGIRHRRLSGNNLKSALSNIAAKYRSVQPELVEKLMEKYGGYTPLNPRPLTEQNITEHNITTEHVSPDGDVFADLIPIYDQIIALIKSAGGRPPKNPKQKSLAEIDRTIRLDKIGKDKLVPLMRWALNDSFWSNLIRSIPNWRKSGGNGQPKIYNCYQQWKNSQPKQDARERRREELGL